MRTSLTRREVRLRRRWRGTNGNRKATAAADRADLAEATSKSAAAAIVAALEQFLAETAPAPAPGPAQSRWQRAALEEGIAARQVSGSAWGHAPR